MTSEKKKIGRPPKAPGQRLLRKQVRFRPADWEMIDRAAKAAGMDRAELIRNAVLPHARRVLKSKGV